MEISSGVCEKVISRIFMTREFIMCTFENNFYLISEGATGAQEDSVEILVFTRIVRRRIRADTVELFFSSISEFLLFDNSCSSVRSSNGSWCNPKVWAGQNLTDINIPLKLKSGVLQYYVSNLAITLATVWHGFFRQFKVQYLFFFHVTGRYLFLCIGKITLSIAPGSFPPPN